MRFTAVILASLWASFLNGAIAVADLAGTSPQPFSEICVAWHLSPSTAIGKGWVFSAFCKNSKGEYYWDDNNRLDDCVSADDHGQLTHYTGQGMSGQCFECNSNDGW